ncbi:MAG: hypothetical protein K2X38_08365 [Gemmataceae bacterium]|nr:hypothetical protein [Gemmataceae bacterium]
MRATALMLIGLLAIGAGCNKNKERKAWKPEEQPVAKAEVPLMNPGGIVQPPQEQPKQKPKSLVGNIYRTMDDVDFDAAMKNIGLAVQSHEIQNNRLPKNMDELAAFYEKNARIIDAFKWLEVQWGAPKPADPANTVFMNEIGPDRANNRAVILANGTYTKIPEEQFAKMPKAQGKK